MGTKGIGIAGALIALTMGAAAAEAKPPPEWPADQPVVGDVNGVYGPGPALPVHGGREWLFPARTVWIEVGCETSTDMGCTGELAVADAAGVVLDTSPFELPEEEGASVAIQLPRAAALRARRSGLRLTASSNGVDNLGRAGTGSARLKVVRPRP